MLDNKNDARPDNVVRSSQLRTDRSISTVHPAVRQSLNPFVVHDLEFWGLFEQGGPKLEVLAEDHGSNGNEGNAFHEAGVWSDAAQALFFTSNRRIDEHGRAYTTLSKMELSACGPPRGAARWTDLDEVQYPYPTPNGGTILPNGNLLMCDQGRDHEDDTVNEQRHLSALVVVDPTGKKRPRTVLNNWKLLPFNSLNDIVVVPALALPIGGQYKEQEDDARDDDNSEDNHDRQSNAAVDGEDEDDGQADLGLESGQVVLFTDPSYGFEQGFKSRPLLPNNVYAWKPKTGKVQPIAEGFVKPNGVVVDEKRGRCYVTDTGYIRGDGNCCGTRPATIHVFDMRLTPNSDLPFELINKRLFAAIDCGAPDGIKLDCQGNVYAGCFDGVHIWSHAGKLLGKILLSNEAGKQMGCANLCFVPQGLVCMAESRMFLIEGLRAKGALLG